jgi:Mg2+ and Co2+ transporter CorA
MSNTIQPSIIKIETLEKEYMVILKQYEEYYNNYISNLKTDKDETQSNEKQSNTEFVHLEGRTYWGEYGLQETSMKTAKECESMCASDLKCTGATFNPSKRYCWTRGGDGNITQGGDTDIAIIPKIKQSLIVLKRLNEKLIDINNKINTELEKIYPIAQEDIQLKNKKQEELKKYYGYLVNEKIELEKTLGEYETIEQQYENNFLSVVSQNTSLRLWTLISLIVFFITLKTLLGATNTNLNFIFSIILFILFILLSLHLTTAQGFAAWGVFILILIFIKLNNLN